MTPPALYLRAVAFHDYWHGEPELRLLRHLVDPARPVADVGANYGVYAYFLARIAPQVYAFEPHPDMAAFIRRSASSKVRLFECALSDAVGTAELHVPVEQQQEVPGMGSLRADFQTAAMRCFKVKTDTLDRLALGPIGFMKIDVEGHEMAVLRGAQATLLAHRPRLLVEMERRHHKDALTAGFEWLQALGYQGWFYFAGRRCALAAFDLERHQPPASAATPQGGYVQNFVFIHAQDSVTLPAVLS
jgi:FkbM family methyltransferase